MQMTLYFLMTVFCIDQTQAYRYAIFEKIPPLCNNLTCAGNVPHTACNSLNPSHRCRDFKMMYMSGSVMHTMILGHNGIRNKIAKDWGIANMNVLHWSKELARLSHHFLTECLRKNDVCDFLVEPAITIGHNYFYSKSPPSSRWAGRAVRNWYYELGFEIKTWEQFVEAREEHKSFREFVQMIWPTTEFIGCAGARMFNGYMATCYYHPAATEGTDNFTLGRPCSKCPELRPTCSRDFTKLCGLDLDVGSAGRLSVHKRMLIISILISLAYCTYFPHNIILV